MTTHAASRLDKKPGRHRIQYVTPWWSYKWTALRDVLSVVLVGLLTMAYVPGWGWRLAVVVVAIPVWISVDSKLRSREIRSLWRHRHD